MTRFFWKYLFPVSQLPNIEKADRDALVKFYANKILASKGGLSNRVTDRIRSFSKERNFDPNIILAIYYIENFYRPPWFTFIEYNLYRLGIIKDPSIGPFQVRSTNLKNRGKRRLIDESLEYIGDLMVSCGLAHHLCKDNFLKLGNLYNLDEIYGEVAYRIWGALPQTRI